jgi:Spy/CpxP family protein refolding chaperone
MDPGHAIVLLAAVVVAALVVAFAAVLAYVERPAPADAAAEGTFWREP